MRFILCLCIGIFILTGKNVHAVGFELPMESYTEGLVMGVRIPIPAPAPYRYTRSITPHNIGIDSFMHLTEIKYHNGYFYITNGTEILILDTDFNYVTVINGFYNDGEFQTFAMLDGIFITDKGEIYVAEPTAGRVVHLDAEHNLIRLLGRPEGMPVDENIPYQPVKVAVNNIDGRIYIISNNIFQGIIELNNDGTFNRFFGVVEVNPGLADIFWRQLQTPAQRIRMALWLPINYTNLDIDNNGFVFATLADTIGVQMLNGRGENVIRRADDSQIVGDTPRRNFVQGVPTGPSNMTQVDVTDFGVYYLFDNIRNRVFVYNEDGYLLFAFGGVGTRQGFTQQVTGMTRTEDGRLVLADRGSRSLEVFERTQYGQYVITASQLTHEANFVEAAEYWQNVIDINPHFQYAYLAIGQYLHRTGRHDEAIRYFQMAQDVHHFSAAFQVARADFMYNYFDTIVLSIAGFIILIILYKLLRRRYVRGVA